MRIVTSYKMKHFNILPVLLSLAVASLAVPVEESQLQVKQIAEPQKQEIVAELTPEVAKVASGPEEIPPALVASKPDVPDVDVGSPDNIDLETANTLWGGYGGYGGWGGYYRRPYYGGWGNGWRRGWGGYGGWGYGGRGFGGWGWGGRGYYWG